MSEVTILKKLVDAGMSINGAFGMFGNIMAESSGQSNIVQRGFLKISDEEYTRQVDSGIRNFEDSIGYGLCQWTFCSRKRNLLKFAKSKGTSVGDEDMQVEFLIKELQEEHVNIWKKLCGDISIYDAASIVCTDFERPAVNNIQTRYEFGHNAYLKYKDQIGTANKIDEVIALLQQAITLLKG